MNRYLRKYRTGGSDSRKVSRIGSPPITDFVNVPRGNPNRQLSPEEQMQLSQDTIMNNQKEIIKQLQINNQLVESQNKLLENQNKLTSMTNSVRKLKTSNPGPKTSPKRKGGSNKKKKGEVLIFTGQGYMRKGGTK
jgi:uncharacterized coiled-coil protein SlyX